MLSFDLVKNDRDYLEYQKKTQLVYTFLAHVSLLFLMLSGPVSPATNKTRSWAVVDLPCNPYEFLCLNELGMMCWIVYKGKRGAYWATAGPLHCLWQWLYIILQCRCGLFQIIANSKKPTLRISLPLVQVVGCMLCGHTVPLLALHPSLFKHYITLQHREEVWGRYREKVQGLGGDGTLDPLPGCLPLTPSFTPRIIHYSRIMRTFTLPTVCNTQPRFNDNCNSHHVCSVDGIVTPTSFGFHHNWSTR